MKKTILLSFAFITTISTFLLAQDQYIMVKSSDKGLYIDHKVMPKENFYAIGRLYSIAAKEIAAYNKLDMNKGLNAGQVIHIPLTASNFSQTDSKEGLPVYHKVGESEGLLKISNAHNKVPIETLRKWNNLKGDNVNAGSRLVVGYVKATALPYDVVTPYTEEEKKEVKSEPVITTEVKPTKTQEVAVKKEDKLVIIEEPKQKTKEQVKTEVAGQGYFKSSFDQQSRQAPPSKNETVTSGIFKTTSGWSDAKYYMLIDGVTPGTVVKISNPGNNKSIYAKVLGEMSGIRQNEGLDIRISNAAASALSVSEDDKFIVKVAY